MGRAGASLYVYAFLDPSVRASGIRRPPIDVIDVAGIRVAVERRVDRPPLDADALRAQYRVVSRLGTRAQALLPVRFGALVERSELERIIRRRRGMLTGALAAVAGRQQMTVRIFGTPRRQTPAASPAAVRSGADYLRARAAAARPPTPPESEAIRRAVAPFYVDERIEPGPPGVLVTIHHLVPRGAARRYRAAAAAAAASGARHRVEISGPLPPYAFVPDLWADAI